MRDAELDVHNDNVRSDCCSNCPFLIYAGYIDEDLARTFYPGLSETAAVELTISASW